MTSPWSAAATTPWSAPPTSRAQASRSSCSSVSATPAAPPSHRALRRQAGPSLALLLPRQPDARAADGRPGLDVRLASRTTASYTPWTREGRSGGLLVERPEGEATRASFRDLTGSDGEYAAWQAFYAEVGQLAEAVAPTLMQPLPLERDVRALSTSGIWPDVVSHPLGRTIEQRFADDTVRGVVATDALIGTFASMDDPSLDPEPLLPLPPDRQRHRRVAGARRRHGRGHRRARHGPPSMPAPRSSPAPA